MGVCFSLHKLGTFITSGNSGKNIINPHKAYSAKGLGKREYMMEKEKLARQKFADSFEVITIVIVRIFLAIFLPVSAMYFAYKSYVLGTLYFQIERLSQFSQGSIKSQLSINILITLVTLFFSYKAIKKCTSKKRLTSLR